ncbi:MAG TPA: hypothetical protein VLJ44_03345 [Gaiellaceae bacterium]|nr:hypothetical protein [Gaiellaceae bacterium]
MKRNLHPAGEEGQALVLVIFLILALGLLSPLLLDTMTSSAAQSNNALVQSHAHAAADAGINAYVAKLLNDTQYYTHYVAPGEATRQSGANTVSSVLPPAAPTPWPSGYGTSWTYASKNAWVDLGNGYSYDLEITAPQTGSNHTNFVLITSTGKSNLATAAANNRQVVQMLMRPASIADFQMFSKGSVCYGDGANTNGKIYTQGNLYYSGTAYADLNAEQNIYLPPTSARSGDPCSTSGQNNTGRLISPAVQYNSSNIRSAPELATKPDFSTFQVSLVNIKRAAQNAKGIYLTNGTTTSTSPPSAWQISFNSNGTLTYKSCRKTANPVQSTQPTCDGSVSNQGAVLGTDCSVSACAGSGTVAMPTNGAIYSDQTVIIAGGTSSCLSGGVSGGPTGSYVALTNASCVKGRVSIASGADIVMADDSGYVTPGQDVLGLLANNNFYIASWIPSNSSLNWSGASLAENGSWGQPSGVPNGKFDTMYHEGSIAQLQMGNGMQMFDTRYYNYDPNLLYLQPPWYPTLPNPYQVLLYRNLPNAS